MKGVIMLPALILQRIAFAAFGGISSSSYFRGDC